MRERQASAGRVGLVPTRGALHERQSALVDRAIRQNDAAIASMLRGLAAEYVSCADPVTLDELLGRVERVVLSLAVCIGSVRLVDNALLGVRLQDLDQLQ